MKRPRILVINITILLTIFLSAVLGILKFLITRSHDTTQEYNQYIQYINTIYVVHPSMSWFTSILSLESCQRYSVNHYLNLLEKRTLFKKYRAHNMHMPGNLTYTSKVWYGDAMNLRSLLDGKNYSSFVFGYCINLLITHVHNKCPMLSSALRPNKGSYMHNK